MAISGEDILISLPEITKGITAAVGRGDALPQLQTTSSAAIANEVGNNLSGATAQRH